MKRLSLILMMFASVSAFSQTLHDFSVPDARTGKNVQLSDFKSNKGIVIIFSSNECPFDEYYADRIKSLSDNFKTQIAFVLVNSHVEVSESKEAMAAYLERSGLDLPYLADKNQVILNELAPRKTPEAFLLENKDGQFNVLYHGAIDDNAQSASDVQNTYLKTAINQFLAGQKLGITEQRAVGCSIHKAKN